MASEHEKLVTADAKPPTPKTTTRTQKRSPMASGHGRTTRARSWATPLCSFSTPRIWVFARPTSPWPDLMAAAGFVNWPAFPERPAIVVLIAAALVASVVSLVVVYDRDSQRRIWVYRSMTAVVIVLCTIVMIAACNPNCVPEKTVDALSHQTNAVTTYNREYCHAWCRHDEGGFAALARGECATEETVLDNIANTVAVGDWCRDAIANRNFELVANYSGVSPFAGLKGAGACLIDTALTPLFLSIWNMLVSWSLLMTIVLG